MDNYGEQQINLEPENVEQNIELEEEPLIINQGGTQNYNELRNKPQINGITLQGNKNGTDYNLADIYSVVFTAGEQGAIYASQEDIDYIYQYVPTYLKVSGNVSGTEISQIYVLLGENNIEGSYSGELIYFTYQDWTNNYVMARIPKNASSPLNFIEYDFYTKSESDNKYQAKLVSGTNIKTINNQSLLGSGNLKIDPAGGANLTPLEVPNNSMNLYDFIMEAEYPETYTISNDSDVAISIEKESGTAEVWAQKGSIISVYPQYSATILSSDGMYMYYVDWESGEYLTGGGAVDYDTVVDIIQQQLGEGVVDLTSAQTITGLKTFSNDGLQFKRTNSNIKVGISPTATGANITYIDANNNKTTKLTIGGSYTTSYQDIIPITETSYNLGSVNNKWNTIYATKLNDGTTDKTVTNLVDTDSTQTITGTKTFSGSSLKTPIITTTGNTFTLKNGLTSFNILDIDLNGATWYRRLVPNTNNAFDLGTSSKKWKTLYLSGALDDGTNSIRVEDIATKTDLSGKQDTLIAGTGIAITNNVISSTLDGIDYEVDQQLPATGQKGIIYLIPNGSSEQENIYDEYIWIPPLQEGESGRFEFIGTTQTDLTNYVDLSSAQTITGVKTFSNGLVSDTLESTGTLNIKQNSNNAIQIQNANAILRRHLLPNNGNTYDIGTSTYKWKDLYLVGNLSDGTNSVAVNKIANKDNFVTLSQADYDALVTKDPDTFYFIEEE